MSYAYAAYGELLRDGANPYAHQLLPQGIPIFDAAIVQWGNPPPVCVYGVRSSWRFRPPSFLRRRRSARLSRSFGGLRVLTSATPGRPPRCLAYAAYRGDRRERFSGGGNDRHSIQPRFCAPPKDTTTPSRWRSCLAGTALARREASPANRSRFSGVRRGGEGCRQWSAMLGPRAFAGGARLGAIAGVAAVLALSVPLLRANRQPTWRRTRNTRRKPRSKPLLEPIARAILRSGAIARCRRRGCSPHAPPPPWAGRHFVGWRSGERERLVVSWHWRLDGCCRIRIHGTALRLLLALAVSPGTGTAPAVLLALSLASLLRYLTPSTSGTPAPIAWTISDCRRRCRFSCSPARPEYLDPVTAANVGESQYTELPRRVASYDWLLINCVTMHDGLNGISASDVRVSPPRSPRPSSNGGLREMGEASKHVVMTFGVDLA